MPEEKDELKPKAMASISEPPQNPNPNNKPNPPSKVREEGELTSSDDDVDAPPAASVAPSTCISAPPSSSVPNASVKSSVQVVNSGKSVSANLPARTAETQSQTPGHHKGFSKNQVLLKPSNPGWCAPGADNNLVISFSDDDDSGSDGEERKQKKGQRTDGLLQAVKSNRKPPALPNVKLDLAGRTAKKVAQKKVSLSRKFASSAAKTHGPSVRSGGSSLAEQRSSLMSTNVAGRISSIQDRGSKSVDLSSSKLQDLRQQIAMCENELKRKIVQKNKENISDACRDVNVMGQNKLPSKKSRALPSDLHTELEEPDRKRLKDAQYGSEQPSSSGQHLKLAEPMSVRNETLRGHLVDHANFDTDNLQRELMPLSDGRQFSSTSQSHSAAVVAVSCSLSDWISRPNEALTMPKQSALVTNSAFSDTLDKSMTKNPGVVYEKQPSSSDANKVIHGSNMIKVNDHCDVMSAREKFKSASDCCLQACPLQVSDSKFESPDASPDNTSLLRSLGRSTVSRRSDVDLISLFENEELHDKELEEAQEQRRKCEIEERNALNAYRRAQRSLAEANARCTYLYRKREMYSAQLRSLVMEESSLLWSSQHRQTGDAWNLSNNVSEVNLELIPSSSRQFQAEVEAGNQLGYDSNVQSADGDPHYRSSGNEDGHNFGSEACSEPDASTSQLNNSDANGVHSRCSNQNLSPDDDDETFPLDHEAGHASVMSPQGEVNTKEDEMNMDIDSSTKFLADGSQGPLVLEAYLRSKLFSRLGVISSSKQGGTYSDSAVGKVSDEDVAGPKTQVAVESVSPSDHEVLNDDHGDCPKEPESSIFKAPLDSKTPLHVEEHSLNNSPIPTLAPEGSSFHILDKTSSPIIQSSSIFRSAMKAAGPVSLDSMQVREQHYGSPVMCTDDGSLVHCSQDKLTLSVLSAAEEVAHCISFGKIDSYTCKSAIDPFWPLCMYELRGRCNDDECPWQHVKDYSRNIIQLESSDSADLQTGSSSPCGKQRACTELSNVLIPPRYLVCLDSLKADSYGSLQARQLALSLKNVFSNSLAVSSSLLKHVPSDEPYLHGNDGCVESYGGSGQSLYFRKRNGTGNPLQNGLANNDHSLEMALLVLNQEISKIEGIKKALLILCRALEADPASLHLWIVYLLLYYSTKSSDSELSKKAAVGEDDFFSCAVKHHEQSYELWLLYINSRRRLNDRLAAYERAISRLCHHASHIDGNMMHHSAAILDLFLQMMHCLCMSGNVPKAVQRICGLVLADRDCDESRSLLLSDILQCLTISDKCIFWVCCVYLVIYRKLPDTMVQQFEFEKDMSIMEWPSVHLTLEKKQQVSKLMEMAIDSVGLHIDNKSHEDEGITAKSAYLIAVNHIKLMAAIDGEESYTKFLEKYKNLYPSCLELVLLSARAHCVGESANFEGFEAAISNWSKEVPGIQCIWNQFVEYVLENGKPCQAKEILDKWFNLVWKRQFHHNQLIDGKHEDIKSSPVDLSGSDFNALLSSSNKIDAVFALLNLSLYKMFHDDPFEAQLAIDKALRVADPDVFRYCVREHAVFLFNNSSQLRKDISVHGLLDILKAYMSHAWAIPARDPLTRMFVKDIQKPRLRQLVINILNPISTDTCLVNSFLDVWFGSSFLLQKSIELKDLVDFVEAILEVSPANYQLVISVCRFLCQDTVACNTKSASVLFWASSSLVNTLYHAVPVPPEYVWTEAADLLQKLTNVREISESFHQRALSIYPFSIKLWKSFLHLSVSTDKRKSIVEAAKDKGIQLD